MPRHFRPSLGLLLATGAAALAVACGGGAEPPASTPDASPVATIDVSAVPELQDGTLTVGSDMSYAPMEFLEEGTANPAGVDIDLARAIGRQFGVEVQLVNTGYEGLIAFPDSTEFDIVMSAITITPERAERLDFVPYLDVGTGIVVPAGNPNGITGLGDLCGLRVAVQLGTIQHNLVQDLSGECADPIDIAIFETNPLAVQDLRTGGSDANLSDYPVAQLDVERAEGDLEVVRAEVDPAPYGIVVRQGSPQLKAALAQALDALIASGEYEAILAGWGVEALALP
jgi:polar amino acid transport system substrate-binding protein